MKIIYDTYIQNENSEKQSPLPPLKKTKIMSREKLVFHLDQEMFPSSKSKYSLPSQ